MFIDFEYTADLFSPVVADNHKVFRVSKGFDGRESKSSRFQYQSMTFGAIQYQKGREMLSFFFAFLASAILFAARIDSLRCKA